MAQSKTRRQAAEMQPWQKVTDTVLIKCWECGLELFTIRASERLNINVVAGLQYIDITCPHCSSENTYDVSDEQADDFVLKSVDAPLPDPDIDDEGIAS